MNMARSLLIWDGRSRDGGAVEPGVYYAELRAGRDVLRRKLVQLE